MADLDHRQRAGDTGTAPATPVAWTVAAGVIAAVLVSASLSRPWWSDASWRGAAGAAVTAAASVWLVHASLRLRAITLAAFTAAFVLAGFWGKWMAASEPLKIYYIEVPFNNDLGIQVAGTLMLAITLGWLAVQQLALRRALAPTEVARRTSWLPPAPLLIVTALALCALKVAMAEVYSVGVPGETPRGLDVPALKTVLYYSSTYGPLACASLLMLSRRVRPWLRWGAVGLVLVAYAAAGGYIGTRAATINAALVLGFVALAGPRPDGFRFNPRHALAWLAVLAAGIASLTLTLIRRPIGATSSGPSGLLGFMEDRLGGLDFLSVAAAGVDQHGSSLSYVDTTAWVEFLTFTVYEYPEGSITGVAASLPGTAFGIGGWVAVAIIGLACGVLLAIADVLYARTTDPAAITWYLGLLLAWGNLLLEGTLYPTILIILSFGGVYVLLALVGSRNSRRAVADAAPTPQQLEPVAREQGARRRRGIQARPRLARLGLARAWAVVVTSVVLVVTIVGWQTPAFLSAPPPSTVDTTGTTPPVGPAAARRHERVVSALEETDFPVLEPGIRALGTANWARRVDERVCFDVSAATARDCVFGDRGAPRTAVVMGDAFGAAWMGAVLRALPADQYRVHQVTKSQCPAWDVPMDTGGAGPGECDDYRQWAFGELERIEPDLLIVSSYHYQGYQIANVAQTDGAVAEAIGAGLARTLARTGATTPTVVLAPPPGAGNLQECVTGAASPEDCVREIPVLWSSVARAESAAAGAAGATYIDTSGWFCAEGRCPGFIGTTPVTVDGAHISWRTSTEVGPVLREALRTAEAVPPASLR